MKLPDPLVVRYFRADELDLITQVEESATRSFTVTLVLASGRERVDRFTHLRDVGWVPAQ